MGLLVAVTQNSTEEYLQASITMRFLKGLVKRCHLWQGRQECGAGQGKTTVSSRLNAVCAFSLQLPVKKIIICENMVIIPIKRQGEFMRKTNEKILRTLLAFQAVALTMRKRFQTARQVITGRQARAKIRTVAKAAAISMTARSMAAARQS